MLRILIAEDEQLIRKAFCMLVDSLGDMEIVGEAENGREAVRLVRELKPDIVLMDLLMPVMDGVTATREIKASKSPAKVIALTAVASGSEIMRGLSAGMEGYLLKKASPVELKEAIAVVGGGGRYVTPEVGGFIAEAYLDKKRASRKTGLDVSAREMEVLELVCQGMRTREVSQVLNISPRTVEKHRDSLRRKFGLRTIAGVATAYLSKKR